MIFDQLKAQILSQAIQGKLVPHLAEEGIVEQLGDVPEHVPFEIPESWKWMQLKYVSDAVRGGSPRPISAYITTEDDGLNWIKIGDAEKGEKVIKKCAQKIKPSGLNKTRFVKKGSLLLTNSMSFGQPYILGVDGCIHDGWLSIFNFEKYINKTYFYYLFLSPYTNQEFSKQASGSVVKNLNIDKVKSIFIPIPPLKEQERIVKKLETLFVEIEKAEKAYLELLQLSLVFRKTILQEAIQGKLVPQLAEEGVVEQLGEEPEEVPFEIPASWKWVYFKSIINLKSGIDLSKIQIQDAISEGSVPYITGASQISKSGIIINRWTTSGTNFSELGDVLITCKGTIGKTAINDVGICHIARQIMSITPSEHILNTYIKYFLDFYSQDIVKKARGVIPGISRPVILDLLLPLPPVREQERIVSKIDKLLSQVAFLKV